MKPNRFTRILSPLAALAVLALAPGVARPQCAITGPTEVCGAPVTLCGPEGSEFAVWTFPDGSMQYSRCITVSATGTYEHRFIDPATGDWGPTCLHTLSAAAPAPLVTGGSSACTGESLELCGPAGDLDYEWSGPAGPAGGSACLTVTASGTYVLRVRPRPEGCWSLPAEHAVTFASCEPPPPPPTPNSASCPRPAWWWSKQCPDHDRSGQRLPSETMDAVAACVAGRATGLDAGLCRTLLGRPNTLERRARRQIATVWANVCAGGQGVTSRDGRPVSLDPEAVVTLTGFHGTVSGWLASAEDEMRRRHGAADRRETREAYRRLIRQGWHLNRGHGIGEVCPPPASDALAGDATGAEFSSLAESGGEPEPLAAELMDEADAPLAFGAIEPNPFSSSMTLAFSVGAAAPAEVTIGVYDLSGRRVRELVRGVRAPGNYAVRWDGRDDSGAPSRGGLYFVLGRIGGERVQSRVTLVR